MRRSFRFGLINSGARSSHSKGGRFFTKFPRRIPYPVTIAFGKPLKAEAADNATVREELLKLGEFCFSRRPSLDRHLAEECVRGLKRRRFATAVIDGTDHSELSRAKLLGAAAALSRYLRKEFSRRTNRHRFARQQSVDAGEPGGHAGGQSSCRSQFHGGTRGE